MAANPNTMDIKAVWDAVYQMTHWKQPVYKAFADETQTGMLKVGDTIHRTFSSDFSVNDMAGDGGYTTQAVVDTDETLVINKVKEVSFYLKELDEIQAHLPVRMKYAEKAMNRLFLQIDADILGTAYQNATTVIDDGSLGGTTGNGITATIGNIMAMFTAATQALQKQNIIYEPNKKFTGEVKLENVTGMPVSAISPEVYQQIIQFVAGKNSNFGDEVTRNGHAGNFMGFNMFVSNQLGWSGSFALSVAVTDGDTLTFNGVTVTFKTALSGSAPSTSAEVLIGANAAASNTNLAKMFNNSGTLGTHYWLPTTTSKANLLTKNVTATAAATSTAVIALGYGVVVVGQTMTSASNLWTLTKQIQHCLFGVSKSISVVIQKRPTFLINPVTGKVGKDFITWTAYGMKVFTDQAPMLVDVQVNSSTFSANNQNAL